MSNCIAFYPGDFSVVNVGDLEYGVHPWVSRSAFKPDDLPHEPVAIDEDGGYLLRELPHQVAALILIMF